MASAFPFVLQMLAEALNTQGALNGLSVSVPGPEDVYYKLWYRGIRKVEVGPCFASRLKTHASRHRAPMSAPLPLHIKHSRLGLSRQQRRMIPAAILWQG